jgi:UDP-N-acetylmuramoyl-tripeptide--D-alanyl-D-alanine ligase
MFNPITTIKYQLYLLQLEDYELFRFWRLLFKKGWLVPKQQRKDLVWTAKASLIFAISEILILAASSVVFLHTFDLPFSFIWQELIGFLILVCILHYLAAVFLSLAAIVLWPFDFTAKQILVIRAKSRIKELSKDSGERKGLIIIGIAGSYGKTTMKEVLLEILGAKFNVLATPESVNTPIGIARWIINKFEPGLDIAIVEMGEHYKGDVAALCKIAQPDIAVVTGINQAHLERMGTLDKITSTIFEIVSSAKPGAMVVLNSDDERVMENYKKYIWPDHQQNFFTKNIGSTQCKIKTANFDAENLVWNLNIEELGEVKLNMLGEYSIADVDAGVKIAKYLGMDLQSTVIGLKKIKPVEHRLQPIKSGGNILVIDDSYNGNPDGVREAIKVLGRFSGHRKIYITPGLVESGSQTASIHRSIGQQLANVADIIILIKNSVTPYIEEGVNSSPRSVATVDGEKATDPLAKALGNLQKSPEIIWFNFAQEAHLALGKILKPGDVILFQNDWGDQYV